MRAAVVATLLFSACGGSGGNTTANHSPAGSTTPSAAPSAAATPSGSAPSPKPITGAYGVLVSSQASSPYTIALIGVDGRVAATAEASTPPITNCGSSAAAPYPLPVSTSDTRVYFMDAAGVIHFLGPAGDTGRATSVPAPTSSRRATFAVSPDDRRIAVVVATYSSTGASTSLYVEDLIGGNRINLFSETGSRTLWAVGWHGTNNLVVGVVVSCTQGGGPFCCAVRELHVVDPATANRRFTLGNYSSCPIAGPASPAGIVCENSESSATWQSWTAGNVRSLAINGPTAAFVSPKGGFVAMVDSTGTNFTIGAPSISQMFACTWIDDTHVMSGGDPQHQPRIAQVVSSTIVPVAASGDCGGRIPGGL
jgi:hypothetical protein